jgi:hypothetical protein
MTATLVNGVPLPTWAGDLQAAIQFQGTNMAIPELVTLTVTIGYKGALVFAFDADHAAYTLCLDVRPEDRPFPNLAILPFGFPFYAYQVDPVLNPEFSENAYLQTSSGGRIRMPNTPLFNPPTVTTFTEAMRPLIWQPQTGGLPVPDSPFEKQQNAAAYYAFDFDFPLTLINNLLSETFALLRTQVYVATGHMLQTRAPVLQFNDSNATFSIAADAYSVPSLGHLMVSAGQVYPIPMEDVRIDFNGPLSDLFMFCSTRNPDGSSTLNFGQAKLTPAVKLGLSGPSRAVLTTNFSPVASLWSPVASLVFTASRFNAAAQLTNPPGTIGVTDTGLGQPEKTSYSTELTLTDVVPYNTAPWGFTDQLYTPTVLHFIQILAQGLALSVVDFGIKWRHRLTGEPMDLLLNPMASISVLYYLRRNDIVD